MPDPLSLMFNVSRISVEFVDSLPFVPLKYRSSLKACAGIYFATMRIPDTKILYVGCTSNLKSRWKMHDKNPHFNLLALAGVPVYIHWIELDWAKEDAVILETVFIKKFNPPLNTHHSEGNSWDAETNTSDDPPSKLKEEVCSSIDMPLELMPVLKLRLLAARLGFESAKSAPKWVVIDFLKHCLLGLYDEDELLQKASQKSDLKKTTPAKTIPKSIDGIPTIESLQRMSIRELKVVASLLKVRRYSYMTVRQLKKEIEMKLSYENPLEQAS